MNPQSTAIPGPMHTKQTFNAQINTNYTQTACTHIRLLHFFVSKFISIRSQGLGPIRRPFTASFDSNIDKTLKIGIKIKYGETPTSWSLRKLHKSGTHAKPSPRRAVLLLVSKTANGWIACISREKFPLSKFLSNWNLLHLKFCFSRFSSWLNEEDKSCSKFCLVVTYTFTKMMHMSLFSQI